MRRVEVAERLQPAALTLLAMGEVFRAGDIVTPGDHHQHTALRWQEEERRFQCPKHKSTFQPDGEFVSGRATRGMDRYPIRRDGATVVVDLAVTLREDEDAERWRQAVVQL